MTGCVVGQRQVEVGQRGKEAKRQRDAERKPTGSLAVSWLVGWLLCTCVLGMYYWGWA